MKFYILLTGVIAILLSACGGGNDNSIKRETANRTEKDGKPIITLIGANPYYLNKDVIFTDLGATAFDTVDGDLTSKIKTISDVNTSIEGTYHVTYSVSDSANNTTEITRKVIVKTAPIAKNIHISEILASNTHSGLDKDYYQFSDWIELHNYENHMIDISGFYISDDKEKITKWKFPDGTRVAANDYILVWADKKNKVSKELHTNFKLSSKGESVIFSDRDGNIIDNITFSKQKSDISCATINDSIVYFQPTPQNPNTQAYSSLALSNKPTLSLNGGFYTGSQTLTLSQENGAKIYYTLDGETPSKNSTLYTKPIDIKSTTVVKSIAIKADKLPSEVQHATYFIDESSTLPVVSLSTDAKYLYDDMIGIYVEGKNGIPLYQCKKDETVPKNYAQKWKRPVHISYYDNNYNQQFTFDSDFKISGQCSRHNKKKSFTFQLDNKYGTKSLNYQLYPTKNLDKIKDFKLRTGESGYKITDILAALIVESGNLNIDYQAYRATKVFMNGEYWGIYNFRERKGADYLKSNYPDISKKKLDIINVDSIVKEGTRDEFGKLERFVAQTGYDLSDNDDYQKVLTMVDEDSFIDYISLMIYSGNDDWIYSNQRCWKEKKEGTKWRWMLDDLDRGFRQEAIDRDVFNDLETKHSVMSDTFIALSKNSTFKNKFKTRFLQLLNSTFTTANVMPLVEKIVKEREAYMSLEKKWSISKAYFDNHIKSVKTFVETRGDIVKTQLNNF